MKQTSICTFTVAHIQSEREREIKKERKRERERERESEIVLPPHISRLPLRAGEWLWDGEPEAAYHVRQLLRPASGTAMVWLSETVHQARKTGRPLE